LKSSTLTVGLFVLLLTAAACGPERPNEASTPDDRPAALATQPPASATQPASPPPAAATTEGGTRAQMELRLTVNGTILRATLLDGETARDFASLLPLTLTLTDYAQTEKVSDLPRRLSTADAPEGVDPDVGDIAYYVPWGNLAIFYRDFGYSRALVKLASIDSGIQQLAAMTEDFTVTIELARSRTA
jgi:hypothetical protein